jgi:site-specific DNA-methyltransferase (adenine-specific)/modification methylase
MKLNKIYNKDCIEMMSQDIENKSVELIFADPPYNLSGNGLKWEGSQTGGDWHMINEDWDKMSVSDYLKFTREWIGSSHKILKDAGSIYIACSYHNIGEIMVTLKGLDLNINNIITWYKTNAMPNMTRRTFTHSTEFVIWATKGSGWTFNYEKTKEINPEKRKDGKQKQMRDMWRFSLVQGNERLKGKDGKALHPTQKPEDMLKRIILSSSNEGDTVLDPFLGSGTTAVVAKRYNRNWIGIEKEKKYVEAAKERIN